MGDSEQLLIYSKLTNFSRGGDIMYYCYPLGEEPTDGDALLVKQYRCPKDLIGEVRKICQESTNQEEDVVTGKIEELLGKNQQ